MGGVGGVVWVEKMHGYEMIAEDVEAILQIDFNKGLEEGWLAFFPFAQGREARS